MTSQRRFRRDSGGIVRDPIADFWQISTTVQDPEIPNLPLETPEQGGGVTATLAVTLGAAAVAGTGTVSIGATSAVTLADASLVAAAAIPIGATAAATLSDATLAGIGEVAVGGTLAATLADATTSATGVVPVVAALAASLQDAALSASGTATGGPPVEATLEATLADVLLHATAISGEEEQPISAPQLFLQMTVAAEDEADADALLEDAFLF